MSINLDERADNAEWLHILAKEHAAASKAFSPSEPRDAHGRWTGGSGGGGGAAGPTGTPAPMPIGDHVPFDDAYAGPDAPPYYQWAARTDGYEGRELAYMSVKDEMEMHEEKHEAGVAQKLADDAGIPFPEAEGQQYGWNWLGEGPSGLDSRDVRAAQQVAASHLFGTTPPPADAARMANPEDTGALVAEADAVVRASYDETQHLYQQEPELAPDGTVTLYRGVYYPGTEVPKGLAGVGEIPTEVTAEQNGMRSWALSFEAAQGFSRNEYSVHPRMEGHGYVLAAQIPTRAIVGNGLVGLGVAYVGEHVVAPGAYRVTARRTRGEDIPITPKAAGSVSIDDLPENAYWLDAVKEQRRRGIQKFSPNEPRDAHGRWTGSGSSGGEGGGAAGAGYITQPPAERLEPEDVTSLAELRGKTGKYTDAELNQAIQQRMDRLVSQTYDPNPELHSREGLDRIERALDSYRSAQGDENLRIAKDMAQRDGRDIRFYSQDHPPANVPPDARGATYRGAPYIYVRDNMGSTMTARTIIHELGHVHQPHQYSTTVTSIDDLPQYQYARGESFAETQAALIGEHLGFPPQFFDYSVGYLAGYPPGIQAGPGPHPDDVQAVIDRVRQQMRANDAQVS